MLIPVLSIQQATAQSLRKLLQQNAHIESKWENNAQGDLELNYYNDDFCDYYLHRENDRSYKLSVGKNTVFTKRKNSHTENPFQNATKYRFYRGQFPKDFQGNTPYALPVKNGTETAWKTDLREPFKTLNFRVQQGDTIYATRSGVACRTSHPQQLLLYHADRTFAAYLVMDENFIEPGDNVLTGQAIGIAGSTGVSISYFFLDENKFEGGIHTGYSYSHFVPVFRVDEGNLKLEEKKKYRAVIDDALIMQDMSKREQKRYLKNKK